MTLSGRNIEKESMNRGRLVETSPKGLREKIEEIKIKIQQRMREFSDHSDQHPALNEFIQSANHILLSQDAKRLRGILPVLIADHCRLPDKNSMDYGIVVELLHFTSLIHDDVIDEDQYRRGVKTLNNYFPNNQAVLTGDFIVCKAIDYCLTFTHNSEVIGLVVDAIKRLVTGIIIEQRLLPKDRTLTRYQEMAELKTGSLFSLSFGLPLVGHKSLPDALECGKIFGTLFQVFDDYLDRCDDDPGMNIFGLFTNREVIDFWNERMDTFMKSCRQLDLEIAAMTFFQHLHDQNYFIETDTDYGLLFRCPQF